MQICFKLLREHVHSPNKNLPPTQGPSKIFWGATLWGKQVYFLLVFGPVFLREVQHVALCLMPSSPVAEVSVPRNHGDWGRDCLGLVNIYVEY